VGVHKNNLTIKQRKNAIMRSSHYRPTSRFNYRARRPARLLNWRSIRNNHTMLHRAKPSFSSLTSKKGVCPFRGEGAKRLRSSGVFVYY
jgi:hypothetical protein